MYVSPTAKELRVAIVNSARELARQARDRDTARRQLETDLRIPDGPQRDALLRQHDAAVRTETGRAIAGLRAMLSEHARVGILKAPPSPRPNSAAEASWVAAMVQVGVNSTPDVFDAILRDATANGERGLVAALVPLGQSYRATRKDFAAHPTLADSLTAGAAVLVTDAQRASDDARAWQERAESDAASLAQVLSGERVSETLDAYASLNAFGALMPAPTPPDYDAQTQAALAAAGVTHD